MSSGDKIYQVNLEELIENYIFKCYKRDQGFFKRLFKRRGDYVFDIRWAYIDFKHVTNPDDKKENEEKPEDDAPGTTEGTANGQPESAIDEQIKGMVPQIKEANKKDVELYYSEYENETSELQTYTFTATRETTSTTSFELQENYTIGAETNLEINLGEIVKIGGSVSGSFSVTETKSEAFSKSLTWNIDTQIKVPSWHKAKASLYVYEIPSKSQFTVETTISLPGGKLPVTIRRAKDGKEVHTEWINDLAILFDEDFKNRSSVKIVPVKIVDKYGDEVLENQIVLTTRGVCRNLSFKNQHVKVECKKIEGAPPAVTANAKDNKEDSDDD